MSYSTLIRSDHALTRLCQGFDQLAALLALTLGPTQGAVLLARGKRSPEVLNDAGTIARRVVQLPVRGADAGAMILRHMAWTVRERYGDGAATAAVLAQALVREAAKMIAAGADPMRMRRGIERGITAANCALEAQAAPALGQELLTRLAIGITGDAALGAVLGEMFDLLGGQAALTIEEFAGPYLEREYLDGGRWQARGAARLLMPGEHAELSLQNPRVLVVQALETLDQVRPALEAAVLAPDKSPLLVVAGDLTGEALNTLVLNHARGALTIGAAVLTNTGFVSDDLQDVALLTGAQLLSSLLGRSPERAGLADFGRARRATLGRDGLTIVGGAGDQQALRQRIADLRAQMAGLSRTEYEWERLRLRAACLAGGVGVLKIGAYTETERALKQEQAKKAVRTIEIAMVEGVVPGGGVAYLDCVPAVLAARQDCASADEVHGVSALALALEAPFRQIVRNHGIVHPPVALHEARRRGPGYGFDVLAGEYVHMADAGVLDCLGVARGALAAAASAAVMTITTDTLVLVSPERQQPQVEP